MLLSANYTQHTVSANQVTRRISYYHSYFRNGKLSFYPVYTYSKRNHYYRPVHRTYIPKRRYYHKNTPKPRVNRIRHKIHRNIYHPIMHRHYHRKAYNPAGNTLTHTQLTRLFNMANANVGKPYAWGGNGPYSYDCSGFTQYLYRNALHKNIPRNAQVQYNESVHIAPSQRQAGDLVFFGSGPYGISHVGLYQGKDNQGYDRMYDAQLNGVENEKIYEPWWNYLVGYGVPNAVSQQYNH